MEIRYETGRNKVEHPRTALKNRGYCKAMPMAELEGEAVRRQIERVLESRGFVRNERLSRFLRFVVDRHLEGRGLELKESVIGVEVFGRSPGYNPQHDPIVRTEARRLRTRLSEYYQSPGAETAVVNELPKVWIEPG